MSNTDHDTSHPTYAPSMSDYGQPLPGDPDYSDYNGRYHVTPEQDAIHAASRVAPSEDSHAS